MKRRRVNAPTAGSVKRLARVARFTGDRPVIRPSLAEINVLALEGREDIAVGDIVRIGGGGLYAGELAVVDSLIGGVIPAAVVRTEAGKTRRVRAIDLSHAAETDRARGASPVE